MAPRRRPTAFEVSFPGETEDDITEPGMSNPHQSSFLQSRSSSVASTSSLGKRKGDIVDTREAKRLQLPKDAYYRKRANTAIENEELVISGEDPEDDGDDDEKPIRELLDFSIFDPGHRNELVTLEALEQDDGIDRSFEAAGLVKAHYMSEEDEGQEEEPDEPRYVHLSAILRYTVDYTQESEPFYIETQYAWYILRNPSKSYQVFYEHFYSPRRVAQIIISRALSRPNADFKAFVDIFTRQVDMFGRTYIEQHIWDYLLDINDIIRESDDVKKVMAVPFVRTILRKVPQTAENQRFARHDRPMIKRQPQNKALAGNIDVAVLKSENQNTTCVTPRIAKLAKGLFREEMIVLGPPPPPVNIAEVTAVKAKAFSALRHLIAKVKEPKKISYRKEDRITVGLDPVMYGVVNIERVEYKIGDIVLFPIHEVMADLEAKKIRPDANSRIDEFFWFAKIIYIMPENQKVHVQWFHHGSQTILKELAHPQELFLADLCGHESLTTIVGKATVHFTPNAVVSKDKPDEYFCKFMHDTKTGVFSDINIKHLELFSGQKPPDNCPVCPMQVENDILKEARVLKDDFGKINGVAFAGVNYHLEDFVLYRAEKGPANIGHITKIAFQTKKNIAKITMKKVGRISDLGHVLPKGMKRDEKQLFLTDETITVDVSKDKALLQVIYVPCMQSFEPPNATLEDWLELSYDHFYLLYIFPRLKVRSWDERKKMQWPKHEVCASCCKHILEKRKHMYKFLKNSEQNPLATLDLFGGVGALSRGLAKGSGCLKVTHAVEIGPSAAKTFARNSPETIVYNQCANEILRYAVKSHQKHRIEVPKQKYDDKTPVAPPPKPGDIQVITAGFPCQSHSSLNMFKNTDDVKSNLILTTLAYLDFYSPKFAYFENVPGFLKFCLRATHDNEHQVAGNVEMGGVKLLLRALLDMNYQFQFGLLQAAHYGTPQRRIRFFLVAAKEGQVLPSLPQPTHDFPDSKTLSIKFDDTLDPIAPIRMAHGTARNPCVTIEDAIGDLPRFDWKHPNPSAEKRSRQEERRKRVQQEKIPAVECNIKEPYSGFRGKIGYFAEPLTRYQQRARLGESTDIQQYTRCILPKKVERVLNVPLKAGADYMSLPPVLHEWQFVDPTSSVGKHNYRRGIYGRLDKNGVFPTTVTNVDPTAKQSQVLHPWCYRMVTVRELARSQGFPDDFVFESLGKMNVVTIHRQIGNAVPLPLAHALGRELRESLFNLWNTKRENAIVIEDNELAHGVEQQHLVDNESDDDSDMYTD